MSLIKSLLKIAKQDPHFRRALIEEMARYEEGVSVPLEKLPEKFQEMNENPPESVVRVREKMERMAFRKGR